MNSTRIISKRKNHFIPLLVAFSPIYFLSASCCHTVAIHFVLCLFLFSLEIVSRRRRCLRISAIKSNNEWRKWILCSECLKFQSRESNDDRIWNKTQTKRKPTTTRELNRSALQVATLNSVERVRRTCWTTTGAAAATIPKCQWTKTTIEWDREQKTHTASRETRAALQLTQCANDCRKPMTASCNAFTFFVKRAASHPTPATQATPHIEHLYSSIALYNNTERSAGMQLCTAYGVEHFIVIRHGRHRQCTQMHCGSSFLGGELRSLPHGNSYCNIWTIDGSLFLVHLSHRKIQYEFVLIAL